MNYKGRNCMEYIGKGGMDVSFTRHRDVNGNVTFSLGIDYYSADLGTKEEALEFLGECINMVTGDED